MKKLYNAIIIITQRLIALMVITVFLAGCASIGKGAAKAVLEK